jgi:hypothetical protein
VRPENTIACNALVEEFSARHLGGAAEPVSAEEGWRCKAHRAWLEPQIADPHLDGRTHCAAFPSAWLPDAEAHGVGRFRTKDQSIR